MRAVADAAHVASAPNTVIASTALDVNVYNLRKITISPRTPTRKAVLASSLAGGAALAKACHLRWTAGAKKTRFKCDIDKAKRKIKDYKQAKKDKKTSKADKLKRELDALKQAGKRGVPLATSCVRARKSVRTMFLRTIPLTQRAGHTAISKRNTLLQKLKNAKRAQASAKSAKDKAKRGDNGPRRKWEDAVKKVRSIEKELATFKRNNGRNIKKHVGLLVGQYRREDTNHAPARTEAARRLQKCEQLSRISY